MLSPVELAFVAIAARGGRRVEDLCEGVIGVPDPGGLTFVPREHRWFAAADGGTGVGVWEDDEHLPRSSVSTSGERITWSNGLVRWQGQAYDVDLFASQLATALDTGPLPSVARDLAGVYFAGHAEADGRCSVVADPIGGRLLFHGSSPDLDVVSSSASLAARVLAGRGRIAPRDALGMSTLAYCGHHIGGQTGFTGVQVVPPGASVHLQSHGTGVRIDQGSRPWLARPDPDLDLVDELVETARWHIHDDLRGAIQSGFGERTLGLTGGKDSRLILAVLWESGLVHELDIETIGPPDLGDVVVAAATAANLGLPHRRRFDAPEVVGTYEERMRRFVHLTSGMLNAAEMRDRHEPSRSRVRIVGVTGEALRNFRVLPKAVATTEQLLHLYEDGRSYGRLGLLKPDVAASNHQALISALLEDADPRAKPGDLLDSFLLKNRCRYSRLGSNEDFNSELLVRPLYSEGTLRSAYALGAEHRRAETLHREIIRRCCPQLLDMPFAGKGWEVEPQTISARGPVRKKAEPLMARLQRTSFGRHHDALRGVLADPANPVWDVLDQKRTLEALDRFATLTNPERRELFGAVTAAIWLGDS
jgi:hypothetical protein